MLLRRVTLQNVRSFLDEAELRIEGNISIIIGPNGGGKTNLLDAVAIILRKHIFASMYARHNPTPDQPDRHQFQANEALNSLQLERHSAGADIRQHISVELEVTERDLENMSAIKGSGDFLEETFKRKYFGLQLNQIANWDLSGIAKGDRYIYSLQNGVLVNESKIPGQTFLTYLQNFEVISQLREEAELPPLGTPMIYLPVNRAGNGFQASVQLANYNAAEIKRQSDATFSRSGSTYVQYAIGRLAQKFRLLLEKDNRFAQDAFYEDKNIKEMTQLLLTLGYTWQLICVDPLKNQYDVSLTKQGSSFLVGAASSGEKELLTYLFTIFALDVRDALIVVDEPELHLHPKWQRTLLHLFEKLEKTTGNQFLLATHAAAFVAPESIQFVSRVFSKDQKSFIVKLDATALPNAKHLLNIVNSQNNEAIFFADEVVLVEGIADRIFFEAVFDCLGRDSIPNKTVEIVSVGGKGFFSAYADLLNACQVPFSIIADLDYVEQIGSSEIKSMFVLNHDEIKKDVIENVGSLDGAALVSRIEEAICTGNWDDANATWQYIKSRRIVLKSNLSAVEIGVLRTFFLSKYRERVYVLENGALEDYLPSGFKNKDLLKLIKFLAQPDFWGQISVSSKNEITEICRSILPELPH